MKFDWRIWVIGLFVCEAIFGVALGFRDAIVYTNLQTMRIFSRKNIENSTEKVNTIYYELAKAFIWL